MPKFGKTSKERLSTCEQDVQDVMNKAIELIDFSIICGHRTKEEQQKAFESGFSKVVFPESNHNTFPSFAVDIAPWPIDWSNHARFKELAEVIKECDTEEVLEWGYDLWGWDLPHWQLKNKED